MTEYGTLHKQDGRYRLRFARFTSNTHEHVFSVLTDPDNFVKWYPFATGEMELKVGGEITFDDGEGSQYTATITELERPYLFSFREMDDLVSISLKKENSSRRILFTHTFDDGYWVVNTAAGWHNCMDVFVQIVNGNPIEWNDNPAELRKYYSNAFNK